MNINQLLYDAAYKELLVMLQRNGLSEESLNKYLVCDSRKPESLEDVYIEFIRAASLNYPQTASIIKFNENQTKISEILQDYNYEYVRLLSDQKKVEISEQFKDLFIISRGSEIEKERKREVLLERWIKVVLCSAIFISGCKNVDGFNERVKQNDDLKQVPIRIANEIEGFGFLSACDALTNLGYLEYVRPNNHLFEICTELNISKKNKYAAFDAMRRIADDNKISPFELDKVFQLVCYGDFYKDNKRIKAKGNKDSIIQIVKSQINAHLTEYEDSETQKNAVYNLIDSFDKLDISESAPKDLNNKFEASINVEDNASIKRICKSNKNDLLVKLLRPFASDDSDTDIVEAEGYINRVETLNDEKIKVTFRITNDNMHKFNLLYLYSNFKKSEDGDYYIPLTFEEKAKLGDHLIDDLYYPFEYYYECIVSKEDAIKRKWLDETKETKYYKLEIKDLGTSVEESDDKSDGTGRLIFYDEENVHGGKYTGANEIAKPESCKGADIKTNDSAATIFKKMFEDYKEGDINIYRVGQGNCITVSISYSRPTKKQSLLVFDAGSNQDANVIESTAEFLKEKIKTSNPQCVYFVLSHNHYDHHNILDAMFKKIKEDGTNKQIDMYCILPSKKARNDFEPEELYGISFFRERARKVNGVAGKEIYRNSGISVFQGKPCSEDGWKNENSQSLMIQLKNTLLPADSYYRFWPDDFGIDYTSNPKQYKKFKYIVAPHHGFYYKIPTEYTKKIKIKSSDKDKFMAVFDVNDLTSKMYITCDDNSYSIRIINKLLFTLGIPKKMVEITYTDDNNHINPIKFTDS